VSSSALFGVFVVLKTMYALSTVVPQYEPATAPRWLSNLMNRVPGKTPSGRFEDYWGKETGDEAKRRDRNEEPWEVRR
jgi:hypothetical protein